jgi:thymidylate kinase
MAYVKTFLRGYVIMDRHVNDFIIGWRLIRISNSFIEKLFLKFPDPDFSFTLYVDPAEAYQRKKDEQNNDLEFFKKLHQWSLELGRKRNHYLMDTGKPLKQCLEEVLDVLLTTNRQAGTESMNSGTKRT